MSIAARRKVRGSQGASQGPSLVSTPMLAYDMPTTATLRASNKKAFAHYFPQFPMRYSFDPGTGAANDYYASSYLPSSGEGGIHEAYGGFVRNRPAPRPAHGGGSFLPEDAATEIQQAIDCGIDGFFCDMLGASQAWAQPPRSKLLADVAAASFPGFYVMLMVDASDPGTRSATAADICLFINYFATRCGYFLPDGRLVVGAFDPELCTPAWWQAISDTYLSTYGTSIAWCASFVSQSTMANYSAFYGQGKWGEMADPAAHANAPAYASQIKGRGQKYMMHVWPQAFRPKTGGHWYDEARNTEAIRAMWNRAIVDDADLVQICTWNDYSEGGEFADTAMCGRSWQDISTYWMVRWKTGSFPVITRDVIYLSHRARTNGATILNSAQTAGPMSLRAGGSARRDSIEAAVFLTAPATVEVVVSGATSTFSAPAGFSSHLVPVTAGIAANQVTARAVRSSVVVATVTSPIAVRSSAWNDHPGYAVISSTRGTALTFDPTPTNTGTAPSYPLT